MDAMATTQTPLDSLSGVGEKMIQKLGEHGFASVEELASLEPEALTELPGVGAKTAEKIIASARVLLERVSQSSEAVEAIEEEVADEALVAREVAEETLSQVGEASHDRQPEKMAEPEAEGSGGER